MLMDSGPLLLGGEGSKLQGLLGSNTSPPCQDFSATWIRESSIIKSYDFPDEAPKSNICTKSGFKMLIMRMLTMGLKF
jgi:hypothetical protein